MHTNPRILLIDSYDSFTFNLASLCKRSIPNCTIHIIKNDTYTLPQLLPVLSSIDAIVIGPGPGNPGTAGDVGVIPHLLDPSAYSSSSSTRTQATEMEMEGEWAGDHVPIPTFGVCLGMQCIGLMGGATLRKMKVVKHGLLGQLVHCGSGLFEGVEEASVVRYHSFAVDLPTTLAFSSERASELEELAYVDDGEEENGKVVMALRHRSKPYWGVQYHPESILTSGAGQRVLTNFWTLACEWNERHRPNLGTSASTTGSAGADMSNMLGPAWPALSHPSLTPSSRSRSRPSTKPKLVSTRTLHTPSLPIPSVCEYLGVLDESKPFVLLDSAAAPGRHTIIGCVTPSSVQITYKVGQRHVDVRTPTNPPTSSSSATRRQAGAHKRGSGRVDSVERCEFGEGEDVWGWLEAFMSGRRFVGGEKDVPFWGGLVGCLSYEAGVEELGVSIRNRAGSASASTTNAEAGPSSHPSIDIPPHPDLNLIYIERSIVIDTHTETTYIQSLLPDDEEWTSSMEALLRRVASVHRDTVHSASLSSTGDGQEAPPMKVKITLPDKEGYIQRIKDAKECLFSGESYELCVTARAEISFFPPPPPPSSLSSPPSPGYRNSRTRRAQIDGSKGIQTSTSWTKYKTLRASNPAPFAGYIRLHPTTLLSTSPERFLAYTRPEQGRNQVCQLRPIKGTLRKTIPSSSSPTGEQVITRAMAEQLLRGSDKEVAENLMIVDLIRHDLAGVLGDCVSVEKFCGVEEYRTVWQMVSVVQGVWRGLGEGDSDSDSVEDVDVEEGGGVGWRVLRQSLPPGSMTGAPKKRSVDILQSLEDTPRSIYSGVFGYWCVGGGGDWSVTIRSCFKYDERFAPPPSDNNAQLFPSGSSTSTGTSTSNGDSSSSASSSNSSTPSSPRTAPSYPATPSDEEELDFADESLLNEDAEEDGRGGEKWVLGAGGAITALSDPEAEWEEMILKLESVCRAFGAL